MQRSAPNRAKGAPSKAENLEINVGASRPADGRKTVVAITPASGRGRAARRARSARSCRGVPVLSEAGPGGWSAIVVVLVADEGQQADEWDLAANHAGLRLRRSVTPAGGSVRCGSAAGGVLVTGELTDPLTAGGYINIPPAA